MAEYYENVLFVIMMLAVGGWSTAVGYGYWLPPVKDMAKADAWKEKHGRKLRMIGPLMILFAFLYVILQIFVYVTA